MSFISSRFDPFTVNCILFDSRTAFELVIPKNYDVLPFLRFIKRTLGYVKWNFLQIIQHTQPRYRYAGINCYKHLYDNSFLFNLPTVNNQKAFENIINDISSTKNDIKIIKDGLNSEDYPLFRIYAVSLLFLPYLWFKYFRCSKKEKKIVCYYLIDFIITPGLSWFYSKILNRYRPQCVFLSNDHRVLTKTMILACEKRNVKTLYVQHASVSYAFPELHFTYSFLDGMDSLDKYTSDGKITKGDVFLFGAIRYDFLSSYRVKRNLSKRNCIGIAINEIDDNAIVDSICNKLLNHFPNINIRIRSHPGLKNRPFVFSPNQRIFYTCAVDETITDYFDSIDIQIANDSGIHFDAIIAGIPTIAFNFAKSEYGDNYGYVANGILRYAHKIEDLISYLENNNAGFHSVPINNIRRYDESFMKDYSGHCSEIVADFILHNFNLDYLSEKYGLHIKQQGKNIYYTI